MPQIAAAKVAAGVAGAALFDRAGVLVMNRIADIHHTGAREQVGVARMAGRHDAVEHIDAAPYRFDDVLRPSHTHEIARLEQRHVGQQPIEHEIALRLALSDREAPDCETCEADLLEGCQRRQSQMRMDAALHDAEQGAGRFCAVVLTKAARRPTHRQFHGCARLCLGRGIRRAFVEAHGHIGGQDPLNAHGFLGREEHRGAVDGRAKVRTFFGDFPRLRQTPHLKTAGIREDRPLPMHEAMQPLMCRDHLEAGPQKQMKGVAEHDFGADAYQVLWRHGLDRAVSTDRHERRRLDGAAWKCEPPAPRRAVARQQIEPHRAAHARSNAELPGIKNIASP